jgi:imidazolonepropionase-like amidohydrolase
MAGTDSYYLTSYPGDLHRELELLVSCGVTPWQALTAATYTPMEWLTADSLGRVTSGAMADFLVLRGDPIANIRNTREIEFVVRGGRVYTPDQILGTVR